MGIGNEVWIIKRATTPADAELASPGQSLWIDTAGVPALKILTAVSPITWSIISGGGAPTDAEYLVGLANGSLSAERVVTNTATIEWDLTVVGQAKANLPNTTVTPGSYTNTSLTVDAQGRLTAASNGAASGLTVGTTAIASGTATRLLYETSGNVLGEISGATSDGASVTFGSGNLLATSPKITTGINDANGNSLIAVTATGSAIFGATLANAASGGTVAWGVTTPTQGASGIAGTPVSFRASDAVAGSSNAGAVAGGSVTITSGDAKRLTSGNANGGAINITAGAGIGTGVQGTVTVSAAQLMVPVGSSTAPGLGLSANTGIYLAAGQPAIASAGTAVAMFRSTASQPGIDVGASAGSQIYFGTALTVLDVAIGRDAAGVAEISNGVLGQWGSLKLGVRDAGTTTLGNGLTVGRQSTGTPDVGFGSAILFNNNSSTTADQNAGQIACPWKVATHATRTSNFSFKLVNSAAALAECLKIDAATRLFVGCPNSAPTDADISNNFLTAYLNEAGNLLNFRVRYSDGTYKTGTVALV